jgi:hypothetical protein
MGKLLYKTVSRKLVEIRTRRYSSREMFDYETKFMVEIRFVRMTLI